MSKGCLTYLPRTREVGERKFGTWREKTSTQLRGQTKTASRRRRPVRDPYSSTVETYTGRGSKSTHAPHSQTTGSSPHFSEDSP